MSEARLPALSDPDEMASTRKFAEQLAGGVEISKLYDRMSVGDRYAFFFFSSRRRHTRFDCDWSSDVCSSDLRLKLSRASHFLDLGCGPGGPLTFVAGHVGCQGSGVDVSAKAIAAGRARAASLDRKSVV